MPSVQGCLQFIQVSNIILLKSCTINYWFHQIHWGRTVLLKMEQIGKCESLFLTAEILNKTGKFTRRTDSKRRKKDEYLINFPPSLHQSTICFCVILKLTENWQEQYKGLADRLDPDSWITGASARLLYCCCSFLPPPFLPPCLPAFGGLLETSAPLPLNTLVLFYNRTIGKIRDYCYNIQYFTPKYLKGGLSLRAIIFSADRTVIRIGRCYNSCITEAMVHVPTCRWIQRCSPQPGQI